MKKISIIAALLICFIIRGFAQTSTDISLSTISGTLYGTLLMPANAADKVMPDNAPGKIPVALLIAGSGPTDRNGNNPTMSNNSLKMLAEALSKKGIASVRYDKRAIGASKEAGLMESDLRFDNYIEDATGWIKMLKADTRFSKVIVIGHSEGSLIGMVASGIGKADAYISIAGAGRSIDKVLKEQIKASSPAAAVTAGHMLDTLAKGDTLKYVPGDYYTLFRPSVQPYMISWIKIDPQKEIKKLSIPILIVQGTTDIQVSQLDANLLHAANPKSKLAIISGMNHVFKSAPSDRLKNIATYSDPNLPVVPQFSTAVTAFILGLK